MVQVQEPLSLKRFRAVEQEVVQGEASKTKTQWFVVADGPEPVLLASEVTPEGDVTVLQVEPARIAVGGVGRPEDQHMGFREPSESEIVGQTLDACQYRLGYIQHSACAPVSLEGG